jgi:hypothetical protein
VSDRIKAIPTVYSGIKFRSKLEARVAQFFDRAQIKWVYEAEGYDIDGTWYLPDFWLPDLRAFVEVKGLIDDSVNKILALASAVPDDTTVFMATAEQIARWESGDVKLSKASRWDSFYDWQLASCPVCKRNVLIPYGRLHCYVIYLAGKVRGSSDWRHSIFPALAKLTADCDVVVEWGDTKPHSIPPPLGKEHFYCGPYFAAEHSGLGSDHRAGLGVFDKHDAAESRRAEIFRMANEAIERCDLFFAWLDDATCYGTLVEIGIAHARGKRVYVGHKPKHDARDDMWFADEAGIRVSNGTPLESLRRAIEIERERR